MAGKRVLRGPNGARFVPHPLVDDVVIANKITAGEWAEDEKAPAKKAAAKPKSDD